MLGGAFLLFTGGGVLVLPEGCPATWREVAQPPSGSNSGGGEVEELSDCVVAIG